MWSANLNFTRRVIDATHTTDSSAAWRGEETRSSRHWPRTTDQFSAPSKITVISLKQLFFLVYLFPSSTPLGSIGCPGAAWNQRSLCLASSGLLCFLLSGARVGRESVSHLEFPVWVVGSLLGIPILIGNSPFQLRCLPDKPESHSRCVINPSPQSCSFEAPRNSRLLPCSAETTFGLSGEKTYLSQAFCYCCRYSY